MRPLRILIDRQVDKIRFDIGASTKKIVFYIETFIDFIYTTIRHIDYTVTNLVASVVFLATVAHTDITISAMSVFFWISLRMRHVDISQDLLAVNMRFWLTEMFADYDASFVTAILRLFGLSKHIDYSEDDMNIVVIRPSKLYEINNKKISELNVSLGTLTFTEIT